MYGYIKKLDKDHPVTYVIHNANKTHGLSKMGRGDFDIPDDTKLFIVPDAGSNDIQELEWLTSRGVDCICLDHHQIDVDTSTCGAIIVNNQASEKYTCKDFSGVGIVYEFLRALDDYALYNYADDFLDLVAFGNISDVMSIKDYQTRYYINKGISNIRNKFLLALNKAQEFSTNGEINIHNISWYWTPICNAMIRVGSYEDRDLMFRAFIETDEVFPYQKRGSSQIVEEDIYTRAARLCKNIKAKQDKMRDAMFEDLKEMINPDDKIHIAVLDDGDPGIIGLSAMKLADWSGKPCVVLREKDEGILSGSCRNCNNSPVANLKELLNSTQIFNYVQGHDNACGTEIYAHRIDYAREELNNALDNVKYDDIIYCDFIIDAENMEYEFIQEIENSKWLYGTGIEEPVVAVENINIMAEDCMVIGKNFDSVTFMYYGIKYCKFKCKPNDPLLKFAMGEKTNEITLNVVGKCSINIFRGSISPQMIIDDYEIVNTIQNE